MRNTALSGSGIVTIQGLQFAVTDFTASTLLSSSEACYTTSWSSATTALCGAAPYGGGVPNVGISVNAGIGTNLALFTFDCANPSLPMFEYFLPFAAHATCTHCFDTLPAPLMLVQMKQSGCCLICSAPVVTGSDGGNLPKSGGASLTVLGLNFAVVDLSPTGGYFTEFGCNTMGWTSTTTAVCFMENPVIDATDYDADPIVPNFQPTFEWSTPNRPRRTAITISSQVGTRIGLFTFDAPAVTQRENDSPWVNLVTSGGGTMTINGLNFNWADSTGTASLNERSSCRTTAWSTLTSVLCEIPSYTGGPTRIAVSVSGMIGTGSRVPTIYSFDGTDSAPFRIRLAVCLVPCFAVLLIPVGLLPCPTYAVELLNRTLLQRLWPADRPPATQLSLAQARSRSLASTSAL
jgi:hypothetical protein